MDDYIDNGYTANDYGGGNIGSYSWNEGPATFKQSGYEWDDSPAPAGYTSSWFPDSNGTTESRRAINTGGGWSPGYDNPAYSTAVPKSSGTYSQNASPSAAPLSGYMPSGTRTGTSVTSPKVVKPAASPFTSQYMSTFNPSVTPPAYSMPTFEAMPTLSIPKYDEKEARRIGYEQSAPYMYQVKSAINRAVTQALGMPAGPTQAASFRKIVEGAAPQFDNAQKEGAAYGRQVYGDIFKTNAETAYRQYGADVNATTFRNTALQNKSNLDFTSKQRQYEMSYQTALNDWMRAQG